LFRFFPDFLAGEHEKVVPKLLRVANGDPLRGGFSDFPSSPSGVVGCDEALRDVRDRPPPEPFAGISYSVLSLDLQFVDFLRLLAAM